MIESGWLRLTTAYVIFISIVFMIFSYLRIQYQFYVWELFIDLKIVLLLLFLSYLWIRKKFQINILLLKISKYDWKSNLVWLIFPAIFYGFIIVGGYFTNQTEIDKLDNWITLILATVFDLPAVFFFSFTSVFIEEAFFRGILFNSVNSNKPVLYSLLFTASLFSIFSMADVFSFDFSSILIFINLLLYFVSIGFLSSILVLRYNSLWIAYSYRIGLLTMPPLILTSYLTESDSFFKTENSFFYAEGLIFSLLNIGIGYYLLRKLVKIEVPQKVENSAV